MQFLDSMECYIVWNCIYIDIDVTSCYWQRIVISNCNLTFSFGWLDLIIPYGLDVILKYEEGMAVVYWYVIH